MWTKIKKNDHVVSEKIRKNENFKVFKLAAQIYTMLSYTHIDTTHIANAARKKIYIYIATRSWRTSLRAYGRFFGGFYAMWKFELVSACNGLKFWQQVHKTFGLSGTEGFFQNKHFSNFYQGFCSFAIKFKNFFKKS